MTNAYASIEIDVDADQIWQLMGGFGSLPDWLPFVVESQLSEGGRVRHLKDIEGNVIIERLLSFNEAEKSYRYTIIEGPAPIKDYDSTLRVLADVSGKSAKIECFCTFTATHISQTEAETLFTQFYKDGLAALKQAIEAR